MTGDYPKIIWSPDNACPSTWFFPYCPSFRVIPFFASTNSFTVTVGNLPTAVTEFHFIYVFEWMHILDIYLSIIFFKNRPFSRAEGGGVVICAVAFDLSWSFRVWCLQSKPVKRFLFLSRLYRLLSKPETWLPEEYARVQIWNNVLSTFSLREYICALFNLGLKVCWSQTFCFLFIRVIEIKKPER